jgi:hypothetical protein
MSAEKWCLKVRLLVVRARVALVLISDLALLL